jgi:hypothetical protein
MTRVGKQQETGGGTKGAGADWLKAGGSKAFLERDPAAKLCRDLLPLAQFLNHCVESLGAVQIRQPLLFR